ncbi:MAG: macro domain-containing protein [Armatimonadota bacterium]|nr:macro domain-containing protein [bacterium]MDW8320286.1 macro domain-containing protein [Armatimonadota bacterium]
MGQILAQTGFSSGQRLALVQGDLTKEQVDAIVNAANEWLQHGGGVAGAIVRAGGEIIQEESNRIGRVPTGSAAVTGAGRLPARYVIHAVGPIWSNYTPEEADRLLASAVHSSLQRADELGIATIAFPAISSGIYGFPKDRCAKVMIGAIEEYFTRHPSSSVKEVRLVLIDTPTMQAFQAEFASRYGEGLT